MKTMRNATLGIGLIVIPALAIATLFVRWMAIPCLITFYGMLRLLDE